MKKVLILCDLFPPAFGPRMGYLCKYIRAYGWEPIVLTQAVDEPTFTFLTGTCPVTYLSYPLARPGWRWFLSLLLDFCLDYKNREMYKEAEKVLSQQSVDLVLCSTYRLFPLPAAERLADRHGLPLVVDLRDIIEQYAGNEFISHPLPDWLGMSSILASLFKKINLKIRNRILKKAAVVTTVSRWHREVLKRHNERTFLIYNGFDPELFYPESIPTAQFVITYTGRLLSTAMRDPALLLEALAMLRKEEAWTPERCRVYWYVDEGSWEIIRREADRYGVLPFMEWKGYVPATEVPRILNESSVLLLLTNSSAGKGPKGVMTTKFFEALAVEKPILCIRSDEGCLAATIKETNAGLAACCADEVCRFLRQQYAIWQRDGYTSAPVRTERAKIYSRKDQAGQFVRLFDALTEGGQVHG